ncbi:TolC family protein [Piscinibacter terrae]|uniref:Protein CyaE n=1 Tax=Piscinibacter terrae TaxID=2496871 RepID=A0A3N7HWU4_9BURK|nr:TolC family protein [Albitalea terrae]RQP26807.1 TolC family protein [Albitalea terrae]
MAFDPFDSRRSVPETAAAPLLGPAAVCRFDMPGTPLKLEEAIERGLCNNPKTRQTWASIKVQAAAVGAARATYLPSINASAQAVHDEAVTDVSGRPDLSSQNHALVQSQTISLSWVLFDFGGREAALHNAQELLAAAQANHDALLQTVFAAVAKDYYTAQGAQGALAAALDIERSANESFVAATGRVERGAAPVSDALQAQTAYAQATIGRTRAEGNLQSTLGVLAVDLGLRPDARLILPAVTEGVTADKDFLRSVSELMEEAERTSPNVQQARAQLRASQAKTDQVRAEGLPSVSVVAKAGHNNQRASQGLGLPQYPATGRDWSVGVQVNVPLFEGLSRSYQVRQAEAQSELQRATLDQVRQQVALDVWTGYHDLQTATQSVINNSRLLKLAEASRAATEERYVAGVGSIVELLSAQSALAEAKNQHLRALTDWRISRLQLAEKLGTLGMWLVYP